MKFYCLSKMGWGVVGYPKVKDRQKGQSSDGGIEESVLEILERCSCSWSCQLLSPSQGATSYSPSSTLLQEHQGQGPSAAPSRLLLCRQPVSLFLCWSCSGPHKSIVKKWIRKIMRNWNTQAWRAIKVPPKYALKNVLQPHLSLAERDASLFCMLLFVD